MLRDDYLTAMVIYFDVGFTKIHKPIWLSTGPRKSPSLVFPCRSGLHCPEPGAPFLTRIDLDGTQGRPTRIGGRRSSTCTSSLLCSWH